MLETNNRSYLTVAIGCTGGKHRSVYVAEQLADYFRSRGKTCSHATEHWKSANNSNDSKSHNNAQKSAWNACKACYVTL